MMPGRYIIKITFITTAMLFALNAKAAAPAFNIQLGLASEVFDGERQNYNQLTGSAHYYKGLSRRSVVNINADLFTRHYNDADWKNRDGILGELIYSYIPDSGYTKPVYSIALRHEIEILDNSDLNRSITSLILADTLRLDDQLTLLTGIQFSSKNSDIEDILSTGVFINTDIQIDPELIVYINLKYEDETIGTNSTSIAIQQPISNRNDFATHHTPGESPMPTPVLPSSSKDFDTSSKNIIIRVGTNYFFTSNQSIDLSYDYNKYLLTNNVELTGNVISLDYFYKF